MVVAEKLWSVLIWLTGGNLTSRWGWVRFNHIILNLKIKNVDTETGKIVIDVAKYDKQRVVIMSESLKNICHLYKIF